jgi:hypothetical protein
MYDLGFPTDAKDVKDLYMEARTKIRLPSGENTEFIPVKRGTIQETIPPSFFPHIHGTSPNAVASCRRKKV